MENFAFHIIKTNLIAAVFVMLIHGFFEESRFVG